MLNNILILMRTLVSYVLFVVIFIVLGIPLLVCLIATPRAYRHSNFLIYWLLAAIFRLFIYASFLSYEVVSSSEHTPFPALYIANHQSAADIIILGYLQGVHPHFWFYWDHFSTIPIMSWYVTRLGLGITQTDLRHDARTLLSGINFIKNGYGNAIIFPEGGRFNDGRVHHFLPGYLLIARKTGIPIIPVYIKGIGKAYPPKSFFIYPEKITIYKGEPYTIQGDESDAAYAERIKAWFDNYSAV